MIFTGRKPGGYVREAGVVEPTVSSRGRIVKPVRRNERTQLTTSTSQQQNDARRTRRRSRVAKKAGTATRKGKDVRCEATGSGNQRKQYPLRRPSSTGNKVGRPLGSFKRGKKVKNTEEAERDDNDILEDPEPDIADNIGDGIVSTEKQKQADIQTVTNKNENSTRDGSLSSQSVVTVTAEINNGNSEINKENREKKSGENIKITRKIPGSSSVNEQNIITTKGETDNRNYSSISVNQERNAENASVHSGDGHKIETNGADNNNIQQKRNIAKLDSDAEPCKVSNSECESVVDLKPEVQETSVLVHQGASLIVYKTEIKSDFSGVLTGDSKMDGVGKEDVETGGRDNADPQSNGGAKPYPEPGKDCGEYSNRSSPSVSVGHVTASPGQDQKADVPMATTEESRKSPSGNGTGATDNASSKLKNVSNSPALNSSSTINSTTAVLPATVDTSTYDPGEYIKYKCPKKKFLEAMKSQSTSTRSRSSQKAGSHTSFSPGANEMPVRDSSQGDQAADRTSGVGDARAQHGSSSRSAANSIPASAMTNNNNSHMKGPSLNLNLRTLIDRVFDSKAMEETLRNTSDIEKKGNTLRVLNSRAMDPPQNKLLNNAVSVGEMRARSGSGTLPSDMQPRTGGNDHFGQQEGRPRAGTLPAGILARMRSTQASTPPVTGGAEMRMSPVEMRQRAGTGSYRQHTREQPSPHHYRHGEYISIMK